MVMVVNDDAILTDVFDIKEEVVEEAEESTDQETDNLEADADGEGSESEEGNEPAGEDENQGNTEENTEQEGEGNEQEGEADEKAKDEDETEASPVVSLAKELDPEGEVKDDEGAATLIRERFKELNETVEAYEKNNKVIYDTFNDIPEVSDFMKAVINGMSPEVAAAIYISETLAPEDGHKSSDEYKAEVAKRNAERKKKDEALEAYRENHNKSVKLVESFVTENKLDGKEFEGFLGTFDKQIAELRNGTVTKDLLSLVMKANKYDKDVKDAEDKGYLRGKNEKIQLKKTSSQNTDGMPGLTSSPGKDKVRTDPDFWDKVAARTRR
jgi:adenylate kinase family enzyme